MIHERAASSIDSFETELRKPGLLPATRGRLEAQIGLTRQIVSEIDEALVAVIGPPTPDAAAIPEFQPLESLHLLHRDWGWPDGEENARALACLERVIGAPLGRVLVLGAGACRLAYDLHVRHAATATVAVDIDPLALAVAARVLRGERVSLTEGRSNATELERLFARRTLQAPAGPVDRFHLLLADGLAPPLRPHSFDTVVTPWFIDLVPPDLRAFVGVVRQQLTPGGRWLNFGPLLYPLSRPAALRFSREELFELMHRSGLKVEKSTSEVLPYSFSPLAERGRLEPCLAFSARAVEPPDDAPALPTWIVLPHLPVPDFPGRALFHHDSAAVRAIIGLVDGRRSIHEIAAEMTTLTGASPAAIEDSVRHCLLATHPARRGLKPA